MQGYVKVESILGDDDSHTTKTISPHQRYCYQEESIQEFLNDEWISGSHYTHSNHINIMQNREVSYKRECEIKEDIKKHNGFDTPKLKTPKKLRNKGFALGEEIAKDVLDGKLQEDGSSFTGPNNRADVEFYQNYHLYKKGFRSFVDNNLNPIFDKTDVIFQLQKKYEDFIPFAEFSEIKNFFREGLEEGYESIWGSYFPDTISYSKKTDDDFLFIIDLEIGEYNHANNTDIPKCKEIIEKFSEIGKEIAEGVLEEFPDLDEYTNFDTPAGLAKELLLENGEYSKNMLNPLDAESILAIHCRDSYLNDSPLYDEERDLLLKIGIPLQDIIGTRLIGLKLGVYEAFAEHTNKSDLKM